VEKRGRSWEGGRRGRDEEEGGNLNPASESTEDGVRCRV